MRLSELLGTPVLDEREQRLGRVGDLRLVRTGDRGTLRVRAVVVIGDGRLDALANATGVCDGRVAGPALLRAVSRGACRRCFEVTADEILGWGPHAVRVQRRAD